MENLTLEQEIIDIEQRLAEKKAELNKEELHTVVKEKIQEKVPEYLRQPANSASQPTPVETEPSLLTLTAPPTAQAPSYLSDELKDKIQELVNIAFTQSIEEAVKTVSKLNNPALLDAFHDVLVDQLYATLIERGRLPKI